MLYYLFFSVHTLYYNLSSKQVSQLFLNKMAIKFVFIWTKRQICPEPMKRTYNIDYWAIVIYVNKYIMYLLYVK